MRLPLQPVHEVAARPPVAAQQAAGQGAGAGEVRLVLKHVQQGRHGLQVLQVLQRHVGIKLVVGDHGPAAKRAAGRKLGPQAVEHVLVQADLVAVLQGITFMNCVIKLLDGQGAGCVGGAPGIRGQGAGCVCGGAAYRAGREPWCARAGRGSWCAGHLCLIIDHAA